MTAVAGVALRVLKRHGGKGRSPLPQLLTLHQRRRRLLAPPPEGSDWLSPGARVWATTWWLLFGSGVSAVLSAAVMVGPPGRKNASISADEAVAVAVPAAIVGLVLLALVAVLRVPAGRTPQYGALLALIVSLLVAGLLGYRLLAGGDDDRGFTDDAPWRVTSLAATGLALLAGVGWRLEVTRRRRPVVVHHDPGAEARHVRRYAEKLSAGDGNASEREKLGAEWNRQLTRLVEAGVDQRTISQARAMAPIAWLVWTFYDAELDVSDVVDGAV